MVIATKIRTSSIGSTIGDTIDAKLANMYLDSITDKEPIGTTVRRALVTANLEERAIVGLSESINALSKTPEDFLFCFLAASGNPANHMHQVLLEAFCFEHDIYIIKVDSAEKLSRMLGTQRIESCALLQKSWSEGRTETITDTEDQLVDYCEEHWETPIKPIVKLPEKVARVLQDELASTSGNQQSKRNMVLKASHEEKVMEANGFHTVGIGASARKALLSALEDKRLVVGLNSAIRSLAANPDLYNFCFLAPIDDHGESGSHMQEVLLEAFCLEHDIYIIRVDSANKLSRLVQSPVVASCALVRKLPAKTIRRMSSAFRRSESILIEHCELYWDEPHKPVVKLPEK
uniref:Ribosomal protein eL8/eL30/eS12/Gadd45 domain-containing protein n=1 Tax=Anopheles epiroticus TaxID=199890 RepID=A0A182P9V9_9DIPT